VVSVGGDLLGLGDGCLDGGLLEDLDELVHGLLERDLDGLLEENLDGDLF
jgi:hypothetical protein